MACKLVRPSQDTFEHLAPGSSGSLLFCSFGRSGPLLAAPKQRHSQAFERLDVDHSGVISIQDLRQAGWMWRSQFNHHVDCTQILVF